MSRGISAIIFLLAFCPAGINGLLEAKLSSDSSGECDSVGLLQNPARGASAVSLSLLSADSSQNATLPSVTNSKGTTEIEEQRNVTTGATNANGTTKIGEPVTPGALSDNGTSDSTRGIRRDKRAEANKRLSARGYVLGYSADFWMVLSLVVFAGLFSVVASTLMTATATKWRFEHVPFKLPAEQPTFPRGFLERVPFGRMRIDHARFAEISFRKAVVCACLALTYFSAELHFFNDYGFSMQLPAFIVVLSVGADLGSTVSACWHNFYGALLPTLHVMFMYGNFPNGVEEAYDVAWHFGVIDFFVFCGIFLIFKFEKGTRMFALKFQVGYTFVFMNPNSWDIYSAGLQNLDMKAGDAGPLVGAIIGYLIALLTIGPSLHGNIVSGLAHSQEVAIELAWQEGCLWTGIVKYYMGSEKTIEVDILVEQAAQAREQTARLHEHLGNTWWECFDGGRTGRIRAHLMEFHERMTYMNDWQTGLGAAMQGEDFGQQHDALMAKVSAPMLRLSSCTAELLYRCARLAIAGYSADSDLHLADVQELKAGMAEVKEAQKAFKVAFEEGRKAVYQSEMLAEDSIEEHFFAFALSNYADYVEKLAEVYLSGEMVPAPVGLRQAAIDGLRSSCAVSEDLGYTVRCCVAFFSSAAIGYMGVPGLMPAYSAGAAATAALLIPVSGNSGSAIVSNMNRFLGIAGGSVLGSVLHAIAVPCAPWAPVSGFVITFIYLGTSFFAKFKSPNYGFVGTLSAIFAIEELFQTCGHATPAFETSDYQNLQTQMIAIFFATAADVFIGNQSAGHLACNSYASVIRTILASLESAFDSERPIDTDRRGFRNKITSQYHHAQLMGHEATIEPRIHRLPWQASFYDKLVSQTRQDAVNAGLLRFVLVECERNPQMKPLLQAIISSPAAKASVEETVARGLLSAELAVAILRKDSISALKAPLSVCKALTNKLPSPLDAEFEVAMKDILAEVNKGIAQAKVSATKASEDGHCLAGTCIFVVKCLTKSISQSEAWCYASPEMK
ncbi:unnamed protein product [Polarella glacialis]|uniref:Uncharacterized protein n=1 Tax=Polarella glacialis TaxID=89957 RepID=A0A813GHZ6_POLGL|nr:unnamed protein product [Polarella glacialis]CAE8660853.1 unnamed protein product [Polarella glacialis]